jgi:hypothetical protein
MEPRKLSFLSFLAIVPGIIIGNLLGSTIILPIIGFFIGKFVVGKWNKFNNVRPFETAFLIQASHLFWLLFGFVLIIFVKLAISVNIPFLMIEGVIYSILLIWFLLKASFPSVLLLTLYQVSGLTVNIFSLNEIGIANSHAKALLVHIFLRFTAVALMAIGTFNTIKMNKSKMNFTNN